MRVIHCALFVGVALAAAGCGGGGIKGIAVEGTVTKDGAPITLGDSEGVTLTLTSGADSYQANVDEKGQFNVRQASGDGIPAGQYKVKYTHYQNESPYTKKRPFKVEKELADAWDVSATNTKFTLDIGKKK